MLVMVGARPQLLGRDTQNALANLFPAIRVRWSLAPAAEESEAVR
jgi:hypothetical protein